MILISERERERERERNEIKNKSEMRILKNFVGSLEERFVRARIRILKFVNIVLGNNHGTFFLARRIGLFNIVRRGNC